MSSEDTNIADLEKSPGFRPVPKTGVIYVMTEAAKHGYQTGSSDWANLGQGAPETGDIPGAPERLLQISMTTDDLEYAPVDGLDELKEGVAELYNQRYRQNKSSKYTKDNVAICSGGRLAVTRAVSALGRTNIGHFLPDYTAYEELLEAFGSFVPIPILADETKGYEFSAEALKKEVLGRGLSSVLLSNPSNPTGRLISGKDLKAWTDVSREHRCTLIFDEFYSHYIFDQERLSVSAAEFVEDVNKDPVIVIDGLTKNWRYPGFRVSWTVGPRSVIEAVSSAGSFLDGGCAQPMQIAATKLVNQELADQEAAAIKKNFSAKREFIVSELTKLGIEINPKPAGSFYCWGNLEGLPKKINTGMQFFRAGLDAGVITVPGAFFDINPGQRRSADRPSRFRHFARFSFGPDMPQLERGVKALKKLIG